MAITYYSRNKRNRTLKRSKNRPYEQVCDPGATAERNRKYV